jgi:hypothetical protein
MNIKQQIVIFYIKFLFFVPFTPYKFYLLTVEIKYCRQRQLCFNPYYVQTDFAVLNMIILQHQY